MKEKKEVEGELQGSHRQRVRKMGRRWTYQMTSILHKILEGYSIQCDEHSYGVRF